MSPLRRTRTIKFSNRFFSHEKIVEVTDEEADRIVNEEKKKKEEEEVKADGDGEESEEDKGEVSKYPRVYKFL
jgi:hypothetical protein